MAIPSPFEVKAEQREQNLKELPELPVSSAPSRSGKLELEARKRRRQTYTVYLDKELMSRVQRLAKQKDVAASTVIEACVKMGLEQLEG